MVFPQGATDVEARAAAALGERDEFNYTFGAQTDWQTDGLPKPNGYYVNGDFSNVDLSSALMREGRIFAKNRVGDPLIDRSAAYHLDGTRLVIALEQAAREAGARIVDGRVAGVERLPEGGVAGLVLDDGAVERADFFVDASGFRSELLGRELGEPLVSYADTLACDAALAAGWTRRADEPIAPHTTVETRRAGWSWRIEHEREVHCGLVFSTAFQSEEEARAELAKAFPLAGDARLVGFAPGRRRCAFVGNVFGIGNAAGFVEPLEATSLTTICDHVRLLVMTLRETEGAVPGERMRAGVAGFQARDWDRVRDFLAVHYRFNRRLDTPFWRHCRAETALHGAEPMVEYYRENGPSPMLREALLGAGDSFGLEGYFTLLLGQGVAHGRPHEPSAGERVIWDRLRAGNAQRARAGFTTEETLRIVHSPTWRWAPNFFSNQTQ